MKQQFTAPSRFARTFIKANSFFFFPGERLLSTRDSSRIRLYSAPCFKRLKRRLVLMKKTEAAECNSVADNCECRMSKLEFDEQTAGDGKEGGPSLVAEDVASMYRCGTCF